MKKKNLVVIGGGAAGIFCAVNAARLAPELEVMVLEQSNQLLSKVRISGGGRCNVTHQEDSIAELVKAYPRGSSWLKKAFRHFFTKDTLEWFESRGVEIKAEEDGRMFPVSNRSESIIEALMRDLNAYGVRVYFQSKVLGIEPIATPEASSCPEQFMIKTLSGQLFLADYLCIACGGFPKLDMFHWIRDLGHTIQSPLPSLFTFNMPEARIRTLMGLSVPEAVVKIEGSKLKSTGPLLITHWGMSGPAILKLSAWGARELAEKNYQFTVVVQWTQHEETQVRSLLQEHRQAHGAQQVATRNPLHLPQRLWQFMLEEADIDPLQKWAELPAKKQNILIQLLAQHRFKVTGKTTFKEEFVTAGGVALTEVDSHTMMSKVHPRLYFAGEILDVDGITGGYNFQHAWTSGYLAAAAIVQAEHSTPQKD